MTTLAPIINRPTAPALPTRIGWQILATLMWSMWLTCWVPLLTLVLWEVGVYHLHGAVTASAGLAQLQEAAVPFLSVVGMQSTCLLLWAGKEYFLFGRLQRRCQAAAVGHAELARYACIQESALAYWQTARCMVVDHDDHGGFRQARVMYGPQRAARLVSAATLPRPVPRLAHAGQ